MSARTPLRNLWNHERRIQTEEFLSKKWVMALLTVVPAALLFAFVNLLPIVWAVSAGFFEISAYSPEWEWYGLGHYYEILPSGEFRDSLWKSVIFTVGSVSLQIVVGTALALLVNRTFRFSYLARTLVILPYLVPTAVLGFVALWMGNSSFGIINQLMVRMGLISDNIAWFGHPNLAMFSIIATSSWKFSIFVTIMVLARMQSIPDGYYEAAQMAGATTYQRFRDITLPNIKGVLFIVILLRGIWMFNKFDIIYVLTQGGPVGRTRVASIYAYEVAFVRANLGAAAAISTLLFILLIATAVVYFYAFEPSSEVRVE